MTTVQNEILTTVRFNIPRDNGTPHTDIILPIIPISSTTAGLTFNGIATMKSFNLAGNKICYTIPRNLSFTTISNGVLVSTINIPRGIYSDAQLTALICGASTGIIKNTLIPGFLIAYNTAQLLSIRFTSDIDAIVSKLLGLNGLSTNQSGSYITYDLPVSGQFPSEYDFTSTQNAIVSFGLSTNQNQNINDPASIPLTILNEDVFELSDVSPYNEYSSSLIYNKFIGNINAPIIYYLRVKLENIDDAELVNNVNNLYLFVTFSDILINA